MKTLGRLVLMKNLLNAFILCLATCFLFIACSSDSPTCTQEPRSNWLDEESFKANLRAQGYEVQKFLVTTTKCFEVFGKDTEGKYAELYFNPVNGEIVKKNKH